MQNRSLIITGADGALGRVVAQKLLADGWTLYASVINEKSKSTLEGLFPNEINKTIFATIADLSKEEEVKHFIASAKDIAGLVHIAGGYREGKSITDYSNDDFDFLINLNAKPTFLLLKEIVPVLKNNKGGAIVTIGAKPVIKQTKGNAVYTASKSAVVAMTLSVAEEGRQFKIRANSILPDTLQTKNNLSWATEEQFQKFTPLTDVADTISFLVSDGGRGITGIVIPMFHKMNT
jgi:NAD(P)-dependent dehydrogenase (short-subunit alcohol dehydrogenase family)